MVLEAAGVDAGAGEGSIRVGERRERRADRVQRQGERLPTTIGSMPERYGMNPVRPIKTARDYAAVMKEFERLWGSRSGTPQGDRLDVLATLIDAYEAEHQPMDPPDPIEAIKFRMEQQGLTRKDLAKILGTRTRVSEVLNRRRNLSIEMIRRLHEKLGISAEVLIRPTRTRKAA